MERRYNWVAKYKELEYKYYRLAQGVQPKPDEPDEPTIEGEELYIENIGEEAGTFSIRRNENPTYTPNLEIKIDDGNWMAYNIVEGGNVEVSVPKGSKVYLRGNNPNGFNGGNDDVNYFAFTFSQPYNVGGYINSLLVTKGYDRYELSNEAPGFTFCRVFAFEDNLREAKDMVFSLNNLPHRCYVGLFQGCTSLVTAPTFNNLTTVGDYSFDQCFASCTSLVTAPTFANVTSVGNGSFNDCFYSCTALVTAPTFANVTSVGNSSFSYCFRECTALVTIPTFDKVTNIGDGTFQYCFRNCTSLVTAPTFENVTSVGTSSFENCFEGCSTLATAPTFENVTNVGGYGFYYCFSGCSALVEAPTFENVTRVIWGEFTGCFSGCSTLATAPTFENITEVGYAGFQSCFSGCSSLVTVPTFANVTSVGESGFQSCFSGCSALVEAPTFENVTIVGSYSFTRCFDECTSLVTAPKFDKITSVDNYALANCFNNCYALVTAPTFENVITVGFGGFDGSFYNCTGLVTAPTFENVISVNGEWAFNVCFQGCTSLVTAPTFNKVTSICANSFQGCFSSCTALVTSPIFTNVTSVGENSFNNLFQNCSSLETIYAPSIIEWSMIDFSQWVEGVPSTGTFIKMYGLDIPTGTSGIPEGWTVKEYIPEVEMYFENIDTVDGVFKLNTFGSPTYTPTLEYKIDNGGWESYAINSNITVPSGSKIYLRGDNETFSISNNDFYYFSLDANHNVGGYITSLLNKTNYSTYNFNENQSYVFTTLFYEDSKLFNANKLVLNSNVLTERCYSRMFWTCTNLQTAPALPATTLAPYCYYSMFYKCTSIQTAPSLPATTLASSCYSNMFNSCSNLTSVTALFETYLEDACSNWLIGVASTGTFYMKSSVAIPTGTSGIPEGWNIEYLPEPFYIENIDSETGYFGVRLPDRTTTYKPNLYYKIDNGEWVEYDKTTLPRIEVYGGSKIFLKGNNPKGLGRTYDHSCYLKFYSDETTTSEYRRCIIGGCITSLLDEDDYKSINHIPDYAFRWLFNSDAIVSAEKLITSNITSVGQRGFDNFFNGCSSLLIAPKFDKVTSVGDYGFYYCFYKCTALVTAPTFANVTNVGYDAFYDCFNNCTSLVTAPKFDKVTSVGYAGFQGCFVYCHSLVTAPTFENVTSVGDFGFYSCFQSCSSLTTSPRFDKVTEFGDSGFGSCFRYDTAIKTIYAPSPSTWDSSKFTNWVQNAPSTGTFYKKAGLEIPSGESGIPEGWTVVEV